MARATFKKGDKVARWERNLDNPTRALKQIGALMVAESQDSFRRQRFGKVAWKPRGPVNVFGVIGDFHMGRRAPLARRFQRRPALSDTGRLAGSISFRIFGTTVVEVGSNLPYAGVHQHGGETESLPITSGVRQLLWRWLKGRDAEMREALGWLLNRKFKGQTLKGEVPARPFVGITKKTLRDVTEAVGVKIMEAA